MIHFIDCLPVSDHEGVVEELGEDGGLADTTGAKQEQPVAVLR